METVSNSRYKGCHKKSRLVKADAEMVYENTGVFCRVYDVLLSLFIIRVCSQSKQLQFVYTNAWCF